MASVELSGWDRLIARIVQLQQWVLDEAAAEAVKLVAMHIRDTAKLLVRKDTRSLEHSGRLSVYARPSQHVHNISVLFGGHVINPKTGKLVDYALYQEMFSPYLRPACEIHKRELTHTMLQIISKSKTRPYVHG